MVIILKHVSIVSEQWNNPPYKPKSNGDTLPEKTICLGTVNSQ
jgi:hypothetical protein